MNNNFDFFDDNKNQKYFNNMDYLTFQSAASGDDHLTLKFEPFTLNDPVNSPSHYTKGKVEAIDVIEDAIKDAPNNKAGFLQGQVLKYLLRLWHKNNSKEDAEKAEWYLKRLIDELS